MVLLQAHLQKELKADTKHARRHGLATDDLGKVFAVHSSGVVGIGHGHKEAHAYLIALLAGVKKDAAAGDAHGTAEIVEVILLRIRRADAHQLRDFAAAAAAPLILSCRLAGTSRRSFLHHEILLGRHDLSKGLSEATAWNKSRAWVSSDL